MKMLRAPMYSATLGSLRYSRPTNAKGKMLVAASGIPVRAISTTAARKESVRSAAPMAHTSAPAKSGDGAYSARGGSNPIPRKVPMNTSM